MVETRVMVVGDTRVFDFVHAYAASVYDQYESQQSVSFAKVVALDASEGNDENAVELKEFADGAPVIIADIPDLLAPVADPELVTVALVD